ncbi:MAG: uroporphyrinogen-III C-methyltransferase [Pseudomonadota bacterium]|nr:uroporphyrinogen-III C-methyltransferase [Pseudomonadota bacterium]
MSSEPVRPSPVDAVPALENVRVAGASPRGSNLPRPVLFLLVLLTGVALLVSSLLWQRLSAIQEQLARQSADSGAQAVEARTLARQAQDVARETAARQAVLESRLSEVAMQRTQLEDLMQSLSRTRDENLVVDIESSIRLAQQQAQLSGSLEPLLVALRTADQRLARAAQPRLNRLRAAVARDIERMNAARVTDLPGLLARMDELMRQVDGLPLANAVASSGLAGQPQEQLPAGAPWWRRSLSVLHEEARALLRVSRIDQPEAVLLAPEQGFFLRENLKLKLLNARLALLSRQTGAARADVAAASAALNRYFDPSSRQTQAAAGLLQQVQGQIRAVELPRLDETLAALATSAAGR